MIHRSGKELPRQTEKRVKAFWDCVAHLMAKRWLREQQEEDCEEGTDLTKRAAGETHAEQHAS